MARIARGKEYQEKYEVRNTRKSMRLGIPGKARRKEYQEKYEVRNTRKSTKKGIPGKV